MKKIFSILFILLCFRTLQSQTIEEGNRFIYYERYQSAENTFLQILNQDPTNTKAWLGLASTYIREIPADSPAKRLPFAPLSIGGDPYYQVAYGTILLQRNNPGAENYFNGALSTTREKNPDILSSIAAAHILARNGDVNYAINLLNKAIKKDKSNPALNILLGDAYRRQINGTEAFKAYQQAIEKNEKYAAAYHKIGEIFLTQKNKDLYVNYFNKAIAADSNYAPSYYELYFYEFNLHPERALEYYKSYVKKSDHTIENEYDLADLFYLNKKYDAAIDKARNILDAEGQNAQPRIYKMISYSFAANRDTATAVDYMKKYFDNQVDSGLLVKDFLSMGEFYDALGNNDSLASVYLEKGVALEKDTVLRFRYYKDLARLAKKEKNYASHAKWLGMYYKNNPEANNVDLFNWGLANYRADDYQMADSVFGIYINKYPEQSYGYYWQAKSKALQDTTMEKGLAVPIYKKLIEVLQNDTTASTYKQWMIEAYGYLAAFEANTEKDYAVAIDYFKKVLDVDPNNEEARKYIAILEKDVAKENR